MGLGSVPGGPGGVQLGRRRREVVRVSLSFLPLSCPVCPHCPAGPEPCCLGKAAPGVWQAPADPWRPSPAGHEPEPLPSSKVSCAPWFAPPAACGHCPLAVGRVGVRRASWAEMKRSLYGGYCSLEQLAAQNKGAGASDVGMAAQQGLRGPASGSHPRGPWLRALRV